MKKILLICLFLLFAFQASAQYLGPTSYGNKFGNGNSGYLSKGYRGMFETGHGFGTGRCTYVYKFSTTHGYQFNPNLYLGAFVSAGSAEFEYYSHGRRWGSAFNFRLGADMRTYIPKRRVSPFIGLQLGYDLCTRNNFYMAEHLGVYYPASNFVYLSGQIGLRVAIKNNWGLNFAIQVGSEDYFNAGEVIFKLGVEF